MDNIIKHTFGKIALEVELSDTTSEELDLELPYTIRQQFKFKRAKICGSTKELVLAVVTGRLSVAIIGKLFRQFQTAINLPLIFIFQHLNTRERERLIQRKVQFMIPGKYLYVPVLGILGPTPFLSEHWDDAIVKHQLSAWAETILIKALLDDAIKITTGIELAAHFQVSQMTISRALRELEEANLCVNRQEGVHKRVSFSPREELWHKAMKLLKNPIMGSVKLAKLPGPLPKAGDTALEHYTMLAGTSMPVYAMAKRNFLKTKNVTSITPPRPEQETLIVQLWHRDPTKLAKNGYIDQISLYLSERDSTDDRIQIELEQMMNELGLKLPHDN